MQQKCGIAPQGLRWMLLLAIGLLMLGQAVNATETPQLWLIGGSLTPCPEMYDAQCQREGFADPRQVALTTPNLEAVADQAIWPENRQNMRVLTQIMLRRATERVGKGAMPLTALWEHLAGTYISRSGKDLSEAVARNGIKRYENLNGRDPIVVRGDDFLAGLLPLERNLLADLLADKPDTSAASGWPVDVELLKPFVHALSQEHQAPDIVVISAARDNAFAPVSAVSAALQSLGATVQWLPLDAVVTQAVARRQCDQLPQLRAQLLGRYHLDQFYPKLSQAQVKACNEPDSLADTLENAHGVLLLDGSLALLQSSLFADNGVAYAWTKVMARRFHRGSLAIAAAGAAAQLAVGAAGEQSIPVMQADPVQAPNRGAALLKAWCQRFDCGGDAHSTNGLGLFTLGAVDTYTAERGREYRLLRAVAASGSGVGFGIDDGTALHITWADSGDWELKIHGRGTVLLVDTQQAKFDSEGQRWSLRQARLGRLVPGSVTHIKRKGIDQAVIYDIELPPQHAAPPHELLPPSRLVDPLFLRSWAQWFVANELPYAEAQYDVRPYQALLRLQRPADGFEFFVADNGFVGFNDLMIDLSFTRS